MLPVKLPHRLDRRPLLVSQTLAHLRTERRPMVSAHVRFKTRSEQRAHGRKHRLAAIHADSTLWHGSRSRLRLRCLHRGSGLRLHLRGHWRLRLSGGRKRHHRAQPNHHHLSLKFFHAFCFAAVLTRSSCCFYFRLLRFHARKGISGSGLCPVTMLRHLVNLQARIHSVKESRYFIYERSAASTSVHYRCPSLWNALSDMDNACPVPGHLLTVEMLPGLARDGCSYDSTSHENSPIHSRMFARRDCFTKSSPCATCSREYPAPASLCQARRA